MAGKQFYLLPVILRSTSIRRFKKRKTGGNASVALMCVYLYTRNNKIKTGKWLSGVWLQAAVICSTTVT
jgi:hypothetical protein